MTRLPPRPALDWREDGTPVATEMDDIYFSRDGGLEETRVVFLEACGLPKRLQGRAHFTVAELGFGTGLNFLALWQMWQRTRPSGAWLHFVSFEGFPLDAEQARKALSNWPELEELSSKLIARWPERAFGVQQVVWAQERISLTLHTGDIAKTLPQSDFRADAWFLDGFSPAKNSAMWDDALWPLIAERTAPGGRLGTFTVAGAVRRGLQSVGFEVERLPGHGRKRQRLEASFAGAASHTKRAPRKVAIIGGGISGLCLNAVFSQLDLDCHVFDEANGPAQGTSGNPLALVMPRLDASDTPEARLMIEAYLAARQFYSGLPGAQPVDVQHRPKDKAEVARFEKVLADPPFGLDLIEATQSGVLHKSAVLIEPTLLLPHLASVGQVHWGTNAKTDFVNRTVNCEAFDAIILASGWYLAEALPWLRLKGRAGQIEYFATDMDAPASVLASGHYAIASGQTRLWGATFEDHLGGAPIPNDAGRESNLNALQALSPYWQHLVGGVDIYSRAGVRATTPDRLPLVGNLPDFETARERFAPLRKGQPVKAEFPVIGGVHIAGGYGSRGFTWGPWAAGVLAAKLLETPSPAAQSSLRVVAPSRQILRDLRRGQI